jgi:hypothetical protein
MFFERNQEDLDFYQSHTRNSDLAQEQGKYGGGSIIPSINISFDVILFEQSDAALSQ